MASPDFEKLLDFMLPFGKRSLTKYGEFFPYGATMTSKGEIIADMVFDGSEHPTPKTIIEKMTEIFHRQAARGEIRASGICYNARVIPPSRAEQTDAICVSLEHDSAENVDVYLPYTKVEEGRFEYGQMFSLKRDARVFI